MPEPTRIEQGRKRAAAAKRVVALSAVTGFAVALGLVRLGHPAAGSSSTHGVSGSSSSSSTSSRTGSDDLGGGTIAPSSSSVTPPVASHTS